MKRLLIVLLLAILVASGSFFPVFSSTFSARVESDRVHVKISSSLTQNITSLFEKTITVSARSLSEAADVIEQQIRAKSPQASLKDLSIQCVFTNTTIAIHVEFDVLSVVSKREEVVAANFTWRAFSVLFDLETEKVHYNLVGKTYFLPAIPRYQNMTRTRFYENRTLPTTLYRALDIAGNVTMLRFNVLGQPLFGWEMTYDVAKVETTYRLKAGRVLDLAAGRELNASTTWFGIWMDLTGEITISGYAGLRGETIVSETQIGPSQVLMLMAVLIPLLAMITVHLVEEKRTKARAEARHR